MKLQHIIVLIFAVLFLGCERDDICAATTPTTPRLVIEFYDVLSPDDVLTVSRLTAYGESIFIDDEGVVSQPTTASDSIVPVSDAPLSYIFNLNISLIELPLVVGAEGEDQTVRFVLEQGTNLRLDDNPNTNSNLDIIELNYQTEFVYVSRACGYKSVFNNLNVDVDEDEDNWIRNIEVDAEATRTIENENTVHVRIFH